MIHQPYKVADPTTVFDPSGHVIAHHCCAAWSFGVAARTPAIRGNYGGQARIKMSHNMEFEKKRLPLNRPV